MTEIDPLSSRIEPDIRTSLPSEEARFLASIAISLKRIADHLESPQTNEDLRCTIHNAITSGIWEARPRS